MSNPEAPEVPQNAALDLVRGTREGPSLQRASVLFVVSIGSFIGASLLLASI